jgi:hypothetical protein
MMHELKSERKISMRVVERKLKVFSKNIFRSPLFDYYFNPTSTKKKEWIDNAQPPPGRRE